VEALQTRLQQSLSDRYRIEQEIGRGGMAVVYLAHDLKHDRRVAIKVLKPDLLPATGAERFLREIRIVARLTHPNILSLYDSGEAGGLLYYVTPYLEGETLRDRLRAEKRLPPGDALRIAGEIADALSYAHSLDLVHRDVKPENVLFQADHAVVSDFGVARAVSRAGGERLTESGLAVGTVAYMSPEQATGSTHLDGRADIYSLGCVLYEMLTGRPPLLGGAVPVLGSADEATTEDVGREPIPASVYRVVSKALARAPADRYATAAEFKEALDRSGPGGRSNEAKPRARPKWRRIGVLVAGAAMLSVLVLLTGPQRLWHRLSPGASGPNVVKLAVLPFTNISGDPAQDYLSDGLTAEMTAQLGRLHPAGLSVIAPTSAAHYQHTTEPIPRIGQELGIQYVLEGTALREGDTVRVTGRLVRVSDQTTMWTDSYRRAMTGILALQSDVARAIARSLALTLLPQERARLARTRTVDPAAYDDYLQGLEHLRTLTAPGLDAALQYFESALQHDPDYALAYSGIAYVWAARQQMDFVSAAEAAPRERAAAERAIALDSTLAEAHLTLANTKAWADWDWRGAETEFEKAITLDPNLAEARMFYAHLLMILGRHEEAMAQAARAVELDPLNEMVHLGYAVVLFSAGRYDDVIDQARIVLRTAPGNPAAGNMIMRAYVAKGMFRQAFEAQRAVVPADDTLGLAALDSGYVSGGFAEAMRRAATLLATRNLTSTKAATSVAEHYLLAHDTSDALDWLERAYAEHDPNLPYVDATPLYDPIRGSPRFQALMRRMKLPTG